MKLTLKQLHDSYKAFGRFADQKIPNRKISYRLARMMDELRPHLKLVEENRVEITKKFGQEIEVPNEVGFREKIIFVPRNRDPEFQKDFSDFLTLEIEIWGDPIDLNEIPAEFFPSGADLSVLFWLFTDKEPES